MTDGLDQMAERRARAKRPVPVVKHRRVATSPGEAPQTAEAVEDPTTPIVVEPEAPDTPRPKATTSRPSKPAVVEPEPSARRRNRVRATQIHVDDVADEHLSALRKKAVLADVDLTSSAVFRLALSELVERHGYDGIVALFADDEDRLRRGRPRQ